MNNTKIIIGVVVVVVAIGAFFYFKKADAPAVLPAGGVGGETGNTAPRSLRDLLSSGQSQKCTFTSTTDGAASSGTVYIAGDRMRGDFTSHVNASGQTVLSHMITNGKEMRMWTDGEVMGVLMTVPEPEAGDADATTPAANTQTAVNLDDTNTSYDCVAWNADLSVFVPPTNIQFHSMADMMGHSMTGTDAGMGMEIGDDSAAGGVDMKVLQCQACDQAPTAAARAQCRTSLQCQ